MVIGRRSFIISGGLATMAASWNPEVVRYPDQRIKTLDQRFTPLVLGNAAVEVIATGCRFNEGPVWFGDLRCLIWSDIPNDRMMRWDEETGAVSVFRRPSHYANGNTRDRQGRLITCEMDTQRLTRTEHDGTIRVLAESFEGKKLTGPNDVIVKSDGSIWFSDNGAGIRGNYLGHKAAPELPYRVYRLDPGTGQLTIAVGDMKRPNGLAFSPDEKLLYVIDTPGPGQRTIQVYDVVDNITLVLSGFDPVAKKYVGFEAATKAQIAQVQANKQMSAKDKKDALAELNDALKSPPPAIENKGNIDLVGKNYDKLAEVLGGGQQ